MTSQHGTHAEPGRDVSRETSIPPLPAAITDPQVIAAYKTAATQARDDYDQALDRALHLLTAAYTTAESTGGLTLAGAWADYDLRTTTATAVYLTTLLSVRDAALRAAGEQ